MIVLERKIVVGSRQSRLALVQTRWVIERLKALGLPFSFEIKAIVTKGDRIVDRMLSKVGGKGLFVKEIEQALLNKEIDFAVHSVKDMPAELPPGLELVCLPEREDPRDCLISKDGYGLDDLPPGAVLGTSSLRRSAQLLKVRPDLTVKWIRGNIDTRLRKLEEENYDAIVLAASGLKRLGNTEQITQFLEPDICLPAVGQGALGIECRSDDEELKQVLAKIHHSPTARCVSAERVFLNEMGGSCHVPVACYGREQEGYLLLTGLIASPDGHNVLKASLRGTDPHLLGKQLADELKAQGASQILDLVKRELGL
jgi:hydroxymethylbilane synthase